MISTQDISRIEGTTAYDTSGNKVGKVDNIYLDDQTGEPSWVTITTGLFGTSQSFVPLQTATFDGGDLRLGYDKDKIKDAPRIDTDAHLERTQEDELYRYYGLQSSYSGTDTGVDHGHTETVGTTGVVDTDTTRTTTGDASMTLSEERLAVDKTSHEAGRARLRKYTTTETQTVSVPVTKEKLVVERQPASGTVNAGTIGDSDAVEEITLREERAVIDKETVAVEEVRVGKETVTEHEQVSAEVRKEHADLDVDGTTGTTGTGITGNDGTIGR